MNQADVLIDDLPCGGCGYNLRGLPQQGKCPECGHEVQATRWGLSWARARWLRTISLGALLIGGGVLSGGAAVTAAIVWRVPYALLAFALAAVICAVGTWLFAMPEPGRHDPLGVWLRIAGVLTCPAQVLGGLAVAGAAGFFPATLLPPRLAILAFQIGALVWGATAGLSCVRAGTLASRFGDRSGLVQATILGMLNYSTIFFTAVMLGRGAGYGYIVLAASALTATAWSASFFVGFSFVLRRRARAHGLPGLSTAARPG